MCVLSINVMLFDHCGSLLAFAAPKVFIFDGVYEGLRNAFLAFEKPRFHQFYDVSDIAECHVRFIHQRYAF